MGKVTKITISLPSETLEAIERERESRGESRSAFVVHAVKEYLRRERHRQDVERYIQGYREMPETEQDVQEAEAMASWALSQEPWDEELEESDEHRRAVGQ